MLNVIKRKNRRSARVRFHLLKYANLYTIRLLFNKSNKYMYLQAISIKGITLFSLTTANKVFKNIKNKRNNNSAILIAKTMSNILLERYPNKSFFLDRGKFRYQGKVQICADSMRKSGLNF